jgi:hypothetical protein
LLLLVAAVVQHTVLAVLVVLELHLLFQLLVDQQ